MRRQLVADIRQLGCDLQGRRRNLPSRVRPIPIQLACLLGYRPSLEVPMLHPRDRYNFGVVAG